MQTEKRLINANALWYEFDNEPWYENADRDEIALPMVDEAPTVDAVEVVRCCQCKHGRMLEDGSVLCKFHSEHGECESRGSAYSVWMEPDDFCSYGERRTDNA